jgi:gamma-glutamyltranspeptidase/glutathione hydrolase
MIPAGDTGYFCTADSDGLVVSIIMSIYHDLGAAVIGGIPGSSAETAGSVLR